MSDKSSWDWGVGDKPIFNTSTCATRGWVEEWHASPDGERLASVANLGDGMSGFCFNGDMQDVSFDKIICGRFSPEGKFTALVSDGMEWTVAEDAVPWEQNFGFCWDLKFAGGKTAVAVQQDMQYGMAVDGQLWEKTYENANNFTLAPNGNATAAAAQVESIGQADIDKFQQGIFSLVVNGEPVGGRYLNVWTPTFNEAGTKVACQVRSDLYNYTIAVDGKPWPACFASVWEPAFDPKTGGVVAPVRLKGRWGLARNGVVDLEYVFYQLWQQQFSPDGERLYAICAPEFGEFTVLCNGETWDLEFLAVLDLAVSPASDRAAAIGRDDNAKYYVLDNGKVWPGCYAMCWKPKFSLNGANLGVKVERKGKYTVVVNGKPYSREFDKIFDFEFSPESDKVLIKGLDEGVYHRIVVNVADI